MTCACGHHHPTQADDSGTVAHLAIPMVALHGKLICADAGQMMTALSLLPDHMDLSRAETGCLRFDITQDEDPLVWSLSEVFADTSAFAAHQSRTADSIWGRDSTDIGRDFHRHDLHPLIRAEGPRDVLDHLLSPRDLNILHRLRADGELEISLIAHVQGIPVGHIALARLSAERPALAMTPPTLHPALHGRGLDLALVYMALQAAGDCAVVAWGDAALLNKAGFRPADLDASGTSQPLYAFGDLSQGSAIVLAAAFQTN
jgi:putative acetyltransferase